MQPIKRTAVLEEVHESDIPTELLHYPVAQPVVEQQLAPMRGVSSDGQICAAEGAADAEFECSPQASEQSIEQIDLKTPGWTGRA